MFAEILPLVDDGAVGAFGEHLGQLPLHLLSQTRRREFLFFSEDVFHLSRDFGFAETVRGFRQQSAGFGALTRVLDRHEVLDEVVAAEQLQIAEPISLTLSLDKRLEETLAEKRSHAT